MDSAVITAATVVCGSFVGALGSLVSSSITQRYHDRRDLLAAKLARLETLYSDFIAESARLLVDALEHNHADPKNLVPLYALLSRIRLTSSPTVLEAAETVLHVIIDTYPKPNLEPGQLPVEDFPGERQIKRFSEICREELETVQRRI